MKVDGGTKLWIVRVEKATFGWSMVVGRYRAGEARKEGM